MFGLEVLDCIEEDTDFGIAFQVVFDPDGNSPNSTLQRKPSQKSSEEDSVPGTGKNVVKFAFVGAAS